MNKQAKQLIKAKRARLMRLREQGLIDKRTQQELMIGYAQFVCRFFGC